MLLQKRDPLNVACTKGICWLTHYR